MNSATRDFLRERLCGVMCNFVYTTYTYASNIWFGTSCLLGVQPITACVLEFVKTCAQFLLSHINTFFGDIQAFFILHVWHVLHHEKMNIVNSLYDNVTNNPSLLLQLAGFVYAAYHFLQWLFPNKTMLICINYATISIYVLLLFTTIMHKLLCLSVDPNVQSECANKLSVAYPSFTALLASIKPDVIVLMITGFLVLVFDCMPSNSKIHLKSLFSVLSECFKGIFVHLCFVTIVLATHGNLDLVTTFSVLLVWFVVESVQVFLKPGQPSLSNQLKQIGCNMLLPKYFCPVPHTPFLNAPNVSKDYKEKFGFKLQDSESEMTLNCYRILPGACTDEPVFHLFVTGIIDVLIVSAFWRHQVLGRQTEARDANEQLDEQIRKLTSSADSQTPIDAKKKIMAEVVAEQNQNSNSLFEKNLRTCYYAVLVFCRLRFWFSPWLDWGWQWIIQWGFDWYTYLML